jgi:hypothetical protein
MPIESKYARRTNSESEEVLEADRAFVSAELCFSFVLGGGITWCCILGLETTQRRIGGITTPGD